MTRTGIRKQVRRCAFSPERHLDRLGVRKVDSGIRLAVVNLSVRQLAGRPDSIEDRCEILNRNMGLRPEPQAQVTAERESQHAELC